MRVNHRSKTVRVFAFAYFSLFQLTNIAACGAQSLLPNPTPEIYVDQNKGGSEVVPNGKLVFEGRHFVCLNLPSVLDPLLNDYAAAPYKGFIILNPKLMAKVSQPVRLWIFNHECAHQKGIKNESKADCDSAQHGKLEGWLSPEGLNEVCNFISNGKADYLHASGPERCAAIRACYRQFGQSRKG